MVWFRVKKGVKRRESAGKVMIVPNNGGPQMLGFRIWTEEVLSNDWMSGWEKVL